MTHTPPTRSVDVLVVGAGPAGLAVAARLAADGVGRVLVIDRAQQAGGVPRHCPRGDFGHRGRWYTGPGYANRAVDAAAGAGAELRTGVTALDWTGPRTLTTTGPRGPERIAARAVVLATGAHERPRAARLVPGTRPAGVLTTGELQQTVHRHGLPVGRRAVIIGAEPVSYTALRTLRESGTRTIAMVTELPCGQGGMARVHQARLLHRVPLVTGAAVTELLGHPRLSGLRLAHHDGRTGTLGCDTAVFTGDFVPEHELARRADLLLDPGTGGPAVDAAFRTSREGVFAIGSVLHPAESAALAAHEGTLAARSVRAYLDGAAQGGDRAVGDVRTVADGQDAALPAGRVMPDGPAWPDRTAAVPVRAEPPLRWVAPNRITPGSRTPFGFLLRTARFLTRPEVLVTQDGHVLHHEQLRRTAVPHRPVRLSGAWTARVDGAGGPVWVRVA